jgi:hypothetical protein
MCRFSFMVALVIFSNRSFFRVLLRRAALAAMHGDTREQALWFGSCVREVNVLIRERSPQVGDKGSQGSEHARLGRKEKKRV